MSTHSACLGLEMHVKHQFLLQACSCLGKLCVITATESNQAMSHLGLQQGKCSRDKMKTLLLVWQVWLFPRKTNAQCDGGKNELQKRQRTGVAEQLLWVSSCKAVCRRRELCVMIHPMVSLHADSNVHGCNNLLPRDITLLGSPFGWSDNPGKPENSRVSLPQMIDPNSSLTRKASTGQLGQTVMV